MTKGILTVLGLGFGLLCATPAFAQSAKHTVQLSDVALLTTDAAVDQTEDGWSTILSSSLKTASYKDLTVGVSVEAGLFTSTLVRSKNGTSDTSTAEAAVAVRVLIDGREAFPGEVVFARRSQALMAKFGGIIESCTDADDDGTITVADECLVTDEELSLMLGTMGAHTFNFVLADLTAGSHRIEVQARIDTNATWQAGSAEASAVVGKGSVVVEEIRLVRGLDIVL
jgi:hypothetical protein